jgi:hypothetical protein
MKAENLSQHSGSRLIRESKAGVSAVATNQSKMVEMTQPHWRKYSPGWGRFDLCWPVKISIHDTVDVQAVPL